MTGDGIATDEQLARIERGVERRIDRRRRVADGVRRSAIAVALVAVVVGGVASLKLVQGDGAASSGSGAAASGSPTTDGRDDPARLTVRCHETSAAASPAVRVAVTSLEPRAVAAACAGAASPSPAFGTAKRSAVVCRAPDGVLNAFPADARPATLCVRNGMRAP